MIVELEQSQNIYDSSRLDVHGEGAFSWSRKFDHIITYKAAVN